MSKAFGASGSYKVSIGTQLFSPEPEKRFAHADKCRDRKRKRIREKICFPLKITWRLEGNFFIRSCE